MAQLALSLDWLGRNFGWNSEEVENTPFVYLELLTHVEELRKRVANVEKEKAAILGVGR